jgi:BNR/Asp-box repeat.
MPNPGACACLGRVLDVLSGVRDFTEKARARFKGFAASGGMGRSFRRMPLLPRLFLRLIACLVVAAGLRGAVADPSAIHVVVSHSADEFAGWPANEGCWAWGDEILVGYTVGRYVDRGEKHSLDPEGPQTLAFSRSTDGGRTWTREHETDARAFRAAPAPAPSAPPDLGSPDVALKFRYNVWHHSADRGRTWSGPFRLPDFDAAHLIARTNYIVADRDSALVFLTASDRGADASTGGGRSFVARMSDGGSRFEFLSWIGPDLARGLATDERPIFSTMPSAIRTGEGRYLCALRQRIGRRKWTDIFESVDGGKTWSHLGELERGATNPAALVSLGGERVAAVYGSRKKPFGLRAKISENAGRDWSDEILLRTDGRTWDLGYPRAVRRPDGTVVVLYYYTTAGRPEQHIAATLWRPPPAAR